MQGPPPSYPLGFPLLSLCSIMSVESSPVILRVGVKYDVEGIIAVRCWGVFEDAGWSSEVLEVLGCLT